jgi:hypothetical protein
MLSAGRAAAAFGDKEEQDMPVKVRRASLLLLRICAVVAIAFLRPSTSLADDQALVRNDGSHGRLDSFDIYHVSDVALYRVAWNLPRLIDPPHDGKDIVHVEGHEAAARELLTVLAQTRTAHDPECERFRLGIDVRWGVVLNFRDTTRTAFGFNMRQNCLVTESSRVPTGIAGPLLAYMRKTYAFLIDTVP